LSDLVLIVGGPFNGQTTHLRLAGSDYAISVPRIKPAGPWDRESRPEPDWSHEPYTVRGARHVRRFFPSWRAFTGETLAALMLAPSVRERGLAWRTMPGGDPRRREYEDRMLEDRLWQSHREFRLVSEVHREELQGPENPGFMYGETTISFRWLADLTPAQLEEEAEQKRQEALEAQAAAEERDRLKDTLRREDRADALAAQEKLDRYAARGIAAGLQDETEDKPE